MLVVVYLCEVHKMATIANHEVVAQVVILHGNSSIFQL